MARRKSGEPLKKITTNVFESDWRRLGEIYVDVGASLALRQILRNHLATLEAKLTRAREDLAHEIDIDDLQLEAKP